MARPSRLDPENVAAVINRGDTYSDLGQYAEAAKDYRAAVRLAPKMGRAYQSAAWFMATCPDEHYRNDKLAIEAAERAIELDGADYRNLATLAAAQANAGMFEEAKATQEKAIAKAGKGEVVTAEKMMSLYHRDVAFRERPRTAYTPSEEIEDRAVRQASGVEKIRQNLGVFPTRQASGTSHARSAGTSHNPQSLKPRSLAAAIPGWHWHLASAIRFASWSFQYLLRAVVSLWFTCLKEAI